MAKRLQRKTIPRKERFGRTRFAKSNSKMSKVLYFGKTKKPRVLVVIFHGMGDDAHGNENWAEKWAAGLAQSLVVVPQSPCIHFSSIAKKDPTPGYDWLVQRGKHDISNRETNVRVLQRVTERRLQQVDAWLDRLLRKFNLKNSDLILSGFSQGSVIAALVGARRRVKAVALAGGVGTEPIYSAAKKNYYGHEVWARWEEMMPEIATQPSADGPPQTKFMICCGGADHTVPRKKLASMLAAYKCKWRTEDGLEHVFPNYWRGMMLGWMRKVAQGGA